RFMVVFPLPRSETATHDALVENLRALGFVRVLADGATVDLGGTEPVRSDGEPADLSAAEELLVVVDRLKVDPESRGRVADSVEVAFREGEGEALILSPETDGFRRLSFTERFRCPDHPEIEFPEPNPQFFSFNSPYGSCTECTGFGATLEYDENLIIPNPEKSLDEGAVDPWSKPRYRRERARLEEYADRREVSMHLPWKDLPEEFRRAVLEGSGSGAGRLTDRAFRGVIPFLRSREKKRYKQYIRVFLRKYQSPRTCASCGGARVRREALNVRVAGRSIAEVSDLSLEELSAWVGGLELQGSEREIAATILRELRTRVSFLVDVGLGYLSLSRQARTLSGGESQRITLANSLGSRLVDTVYILDEPSIGLHPRDTGALLELLGQLRDGGNTVIVVEHDPQAIRAADHVVELGPGSGEHGGRVVFEGTPEELEEADTSTGRYLSGRMDTEGKRATRRVDGARLRLKGARLHNVDNVHLELPLRTLTVVTGVSGSGKSTLVHDILYRALERELGGGETSAKEHLG
ncbi:MAG: excinuclease ABC subunit UvrA, partial [Gemmatimonadota bacterium]